MNHHTMLERTPVTKHSDEVQRKLSAVEFHSLSLNLSLESSDFAWQALEPIFELKGTLRGLDKIILKTKLTVVLADETPMLGLILSYTAYTTVLSVMWNMNIADTV